MKKEDYHWWQTDVIYQIYPRSYHDTTGNGIGDIPGIIDKLPYLSDTLGIDAIWLSPFYPSPMKDFGYDVSNYIDINPLFGSLDDFDQLLSKLHQRGMKLIIDLVPNHSSDQHPWFIESKSSRDNPKRDWYVWADPKPDGSPPNNWLSVFGGPAWEWDEGTRQYYLHSFLKEQPDLNWRNTDVKAAMFDVVRFWLKKGVDGFRIDVAHFVMKDPEMRDNPLNPDQAPSIHRPLGEYDSQHHLYDKGHPDNHKLYQELRGVLEEFNGDRPRVSIGEIHITDMKQWSSYYGKNLDEIHLPFNFSLLGVNWTATDVRQKVDQLEKILPQGAWPNYVLGNHDEQRLASRIGIDQTRIAAMLLLTLRGTPTIYYGEELGMTNVDIPPGREQDPAGLNQPGLGQGRDMCRTPMQWNANPWAGFSPPEIKETWLPVADDFQTVNVAVQLNNSTSLLQLYIKLLEIRKSFPGLQIGDYNPLDEVPEKCFCYLRETPDQKLLICLNFSPYEQHLESHLLQDAEWIISTHLDRTGQVSNAVNLRPNEGCIFKL